MRAIPTLQPLSKKEQKPFRDCGTPTPEGN
jgi:hypothetical protein